MLSSRHYLCQRRGIFASGFPLGKFRIKNWHLGDVLTWRPVGHDVKDNHELTEVDVAVLETKNLLIQRRATVQMKIRHRNSDFAF